MSGFLRQPKLRPRAFVARVQRSGTRDPEGLETPDPGLRAARSIRATKIDCHSDQAIASRPRAGSRSSRKLAIVTFSRFQPMPLTKAAV